MGNIYLRAVQIFLISFICVQYATASDWKSDPNYEFKFSSAISCFKKTKKDFPSIGWSDFADWYLMIFKKGKKVVKGAKCFIRCCLEKIGFYDKDEEKWNIERVKEKFGEDIPDEKQMKCAEEVEDEEGHCTKAWAPFYCLVKSSGAYRQALLKGMYGEKIGMKLFDATEKVRNTVIKAFKRAMFWK